MAGDFELVDDRSGSVLPALRAACPSFEPRWQAHVADWGGGPAGHYNDIGEFAHHLVDLLERNETAEFPEVFATVERLLAADEVGVRELITVGLLEDLQSISMNARTLPSRSAFARGSVHSRPWRGMRCTGSGEVTTAGVPGNTPEGVAATAFGARWMSRPSQDQAGRSGRSEVGMRRRLLGVAVSTVVVSAFVWAFVGPEAVAAVTGEGCLLDQSIDAAPGARVHLDVRVQPNQSIRVVVASPGGLDVYLEQPVVANDHGEVRLTLGMNRLGFGGGRLVVSAITETGCAPGRIKVWASLPDTATDPTLRSSDAPGPGVRAIAMIATAAVGALLTVTKRGRATALMRPAR